MSEGNDTEWMHLAFDFKFLDAWVNWDEVDKKKLLLGMGKAAAYLLLSGDLDDENLNNVGVFVRNLALHETDFITDEMLSEVIAEFEKDGDDL